MRTRTLAGICAAAFAGLGALLVGSAPGASAKGGGGGGGGTPVDTGTVYYRVASAGQWQWGRMNADGTGKTFLAAGVWGEPSHGKHATPDDATSERWFLRLEEVRNADGTAATFTTGDHQAEIFAVSESGDRVQITNNVGAGIVPDHTNDNAWDERCQWIGKVTDGTDTKISFLGYKVLVDQTNELNWGICVVTVDWAAIASRASNASAATTLIPGFVDAGLRRDGNNPNGGFAQNIDYAWSPDGRAVTYAKLFNGGADINHIWDIWRCDFTATGGVESSPLGHRLLAENGSPEDWSTTGRLACWLIYGGLYSIDPNTGGSYVQLVQPPRVIGPQAVYDPRWSPAGNYLVYVYQDSSSSNPSRRYTDVRRVSATGSGDTNLTGDVGGWVQPVGWR